MGKHVKSILVPVDFSENTELAISKALGFYREGIAESTIHLFHVQRSSSRGISNFLSNIKSAFTQEEINTDIQNSKAKLEGLKLAIEKAHKKIKVCCWVSFGERVQESIIKKANQLSVDLIIIGKKSHHSTFPFLNTVIPSKLSLSTGISVLTAKPGSLNKEIKTIVITVSQNFPDKKLEILAAFRNKPRPHIWLVIFNNDTIEFTESRNFLLESFRMLKSQLVNLVNYEVLDGSNKAVALLKYCDKVGADILIVTPGSETRVGNWFNSHISDLVPTQSKTQILAVAPG